HGSHTSLPVCDSSLTTSPLGTRWRRRQALDVPLWLQYPADTGDRHKPFAFQSTGTRPHRCTDTCRAQSGHSHKDVPTSVRRWTCQNPASHESGTGSQQDFLSQDFTCHLWCTEFLQKPFQLETKTCTFRLYSREDSFSNLELEGFVNRSGHSSLRGSSNRFKKLLVFDDIAWLVVGAFLSDHSLQDCINLGLDLGLDLVRRDVVQHLFADFDFQFWIILEQCT